VVEGIEGVESADSRDAVDGWLLPDPGLISGFEEQLFVDHEGVFEDDIEETMKRSETWESVRWSQLAPAFHGSRRLS
jgi:hypothetical protein